MITVGITMKIHMTGILIKIGKIYYDNFTPYIFSIVKVLQTLPKLTTLSTNLKIPGKTINGMISGSSHISMKLNMKKSKFQNGIGKINGG